MSKRKKHPDKDIEAAVAYAESKKWTFKETGKSAHAWGILKCPNNKKDCRCGEFCISSIWSTPKNPKNHAKQIIRIVDNCIYIDKESGN